MSTEPQLREMSKMDDAPVLIGKAKPAFIGKVEIARSFSYKLNMESHGGERFESRDFFCSEKAECLPEDAEQTSEWLYSFCKSQVMKSVQEYLQVHAARKAAMQEKRRTA